MTKGDMMLATKQTAASKAAPVVTIEPWPGEGQWVWRGRKKILVDGEQWGTIYMEGHGCHGVGYWFEQVGVHGRISESGKQGRHSWIEVRSIKPSRWSGEQPPAPIEQRLRDQARDLVARQMLKDPAAIERERAAAAERRRSRGEQEAKQQQAADLAAAHALIAEHAPGLNDREPLANAIAGALATARERVI
jgi:hypothetical protein